MSASNTEEFEPNLTPILDMVFQLITFFMLVINFKGAAMDLSLKLPVLGSARPLEYVGKYEPLTLNIDQDGNVKSNGQVIDVENYLATEANQLKQFLKAVGTTLENGELPTPVIIRADKSVSFTSLLRIMRLCETQGYTQIALSAMSRQGGQ